MRRSPRQTDNMKRIIPKENKHYPPAHEIFLGNDGLYHFIYKIINTTNNKYYIGIHTTSNYKDSYSGSGSTHIRALKKYGAENFQMYVLKFYQSRNDLLNAENKIVDEVLINDPNCYNISIGGHQGSAGVIVGKTIDGNTILVNSSNPMWQNGEVVGVTKGKILAKDKLGNVLLIDPNNPMWQNGEVVGVTKGKILVEDLNGNKMLVEKTDPRYNISLIPIGAGRVHIYQGSVEKFVKKSELNQYLSAGWNIGSPKSSTTRDRIYVHSGDVSKAIKKSELNQYLSAGWLKGRKPKNNVKRWVFTKNGIRKYISNNEVKMYLLEGWIPSVKYKQQYGV